MRDDDEDDLNGFHAFTAAVVLVAVALCGGLIAGEALIFLAGLFRA